MLKGRIGQKAMDGWKLDMVLATDGWLPRVRREPIQWVCILIPDVDIWRMERNPSCLVDLAHIKGIFFGKKGMAGISGTEKNIGKKRNTLLLIVLELSPLEEHHC